MALMVIVPPRDADALGIPLRSDVLSWAEGWPDFAAHVQRAREENHANLLISHHYGFASILAFYLSDHPATQLPPATYGASPFTLWPDYPLEPKTRALFVTSPRNPPPDALQRQFTKIERVDDFWSHEEGRPAHHFLVYLCARN